jgi:hypothetical protein
MAVRWIASGMKPPTLGENIKPAFCVTRCAEMAISQGANPDRRWAEECSLVPLSVGAGHRGRRASVPECDLRSLAVRLPCGTRANAPTPPARWRAKAASMPGLDQNAGFELYSGRPANLKKNQVEGRTQRSLSPLFEAYSEFGIAWVNPISYVGALSGTVVWFRRI